MQLRFTFAVMALCGRAFTLEQPPEDIAVKRIQNHLAIKDPFTAVSEAEKYISLYPQFDPLKLAYLKALCQKGEEVAAYDQFLSIFQTTETQGTSNRSTLEWMAWGVLNKGDESPLLLVRLYALLGAGFTRDAKAIPLIVKELKGSNSLLRSLAIKLSAQYGDAPLRFELLRLLKDERVWFIRLDVIQAIGKLKIEEAKPSLEKIVSSSRSLAEEKVAAIIALTEMYESTTLEEISLLVQSNRAGLRHLACEVIAHLDFVPGLELIIPLLSDSSPQVRIAAMKAIGLMQAVSIGGISTLALAEKNQQDAHPEVSIMAGWLSSVLGGSQDTLERWIDQPRGEFKRLAASALSVTGLRAEKLLLKKLKETTDPYVKVHLAIGLISLRRHVPTASKSLAEVLDQGASELWMWDAGANGFFKTLSPSTVRQREGVPNYPQLVDHLVKIDLFSLLSIVEYPSGLESLRAFLKKQAWGVTAAAASSLLQEGDESSLEIVRELLSDPDEKVRIQAAFILAMLGNDPSVVKILISAYPVVDREMKMHILEALGKIGEASSIPFLLELLKEPFQGVRVVAASALIQCLYH